MSGWMLLAAIALGLIALLAVSFLIGWLWLANKMMQTISDVEDGAPMTARRMVGRRVESTPLWKSTHTHR